MKSFKTFSYRSFLSVLTMFLALTSQVFAQGSKTFASKGVTELGGSISFQSQTPIIDGNSLAGSSIFSFSPYVGYFVADGFELGFNPPGISTFSAGGKTVTQLTIFAAPSYNFRTEGIAYPFFEALLGYTSSSDGATQSGFSWGGRGGVKLAITGGALLNLAVQYTEITLNASGATSRTGTNQLLLSVGFSVWL